MRILNYNTIVLSGGGIKGIGMLGALQYLADQNKLKNIHKFIGTSIGAIIGYLISIGYTPIEIMITINQEKIIEKIMNAISIPDLINKGGAMNFFILHDFLEQMTIKKIGHLLNLKQLYDEFGKHLVCCVYNYNKGICEYFDYMNNPNLPCITALRMTSNLPFLFYPYHYENQLYLDGAILENLPLSQLQEDDISIAIHLTNPKSPCVKDKKEPFHFINYFFDILFIPIQSVQKYIGMSTNHKPNDLIKIPLDIAVFNWNISMSEKFEAFSVGYDTIKNHFQLKYIIPYVERPL